MWTAKSLKKYWPERESLLLALLTLLVFLWMEEHWPRVHSLGARAGINLSSSRTSGSSAGAGSCR